MTRPLHLTAIYTLGEQTRKKASRGRRFTTHTYALSLIPSFSLTPRQADKLKLSRHEKILKLGIHSSSATTAATETEENKEVFSIAGRFDSFDLSLRFGKDQSIIYELVNRLQGRKPPSEAICEERMRL